MWGKTITRQAGAQVLGLIVLAGRVGAQAPVPIADDLQVNTYTTGQQNSPSVAVDATGKFVVVWTSEGSNGTDASGTSVQGQRFDTSGMPIGGEFQVNSYTTSTQSSRYGSSISMNADGSFVVVWGSIGSYGSDGDGYSVQAQRFEASGSPTGLQFQVNTYTTSTQFGASVDVELDGTFVVVWASDGSYGTDNDDFSIRGQRFEADGSMLGDPFQVNTFTAGRQIVPKLTVTPGGLFAVAWESVGSSGSDSSGRSVQARIFDAAGDPVGADFQVNTYTAGDQRFPSVGISSDGIVTIVWSSNAAAGSDTSFTSVQGQRYDSTGNPIGGEFQVNTYTTNHQRYPSVAVEPDGDFVVVWESDGSFGTDLSNSSIQGQRYDASGAPVGGEFQVNSHTTAFQARPYLAAGPDGRFIVAWDSGSSAGTDTLEQSVQMRGFDTPIFADGFESGDVSAWSGSTP